MHDADDRRRIRCGSLMLALCCAAAVAQDGVDDEGRDAYLPKAFIRGVEARLPAEMREDEPLLIGIEQHDHFRDRTPLLADADKTARRVDVDELYARRLAMYEAGAADLDAAGVRPGASAAAGARPRPPAPMPTANGFGVDKGIFRRIMLAVGAALAVAAAVMSFHRRRRAAAAEERAARRRRPRG